MAYRMEALQVRLVAKGGKVPGNTILVTIKREKQDGTTKVAISFIIRQV